MHPGHTGGRSNPLLFLPLPLLLPLLLLLLLSCPCPLPPLLGDLLTRAPVLLAGCRAGESPQWSVAWGDTHSHRCRGESGGRCRGSGDRAGGTGAGGAWCRGGRGTAGLLTCFGGISPISWQLGWQGLAGTDLGPVWPGRNVFRLTHIYILI